MRNKPVDRITQLLQAGLGSDISKLANYRMVMQDPRKWYNNTVYREYSLEIFEKLLDFTLNDNMLYTRLRQLLIDAGHHVPEKHTTINRVDLLKKLSKGRKKP